MKPVPPVQPPIRLADCPPGFHDGLAKAAARKRTEAWCARIGELQPLLYANARHALLLVFQGMDTSGKDGAARGVLSAVNPAGVETADFKQPSAEELAHDFLWRIHRAVPVRGMIGVFNRSHYESVLVERVMGLQPKSVLRARYRQINEFERYLAENRVIVLKFFLHLSRDEQRRRLESRLADPAKNWKFSPDDLKSRAHWDEYQAAYEVALNRCSTRRAPWYLIPADHKWYRDYLIAQVVVHALEALRMEWPPLAVDCAKVRID